MGATKFKELIFVLIVNISVDFCLVKSSLNVKSQNYDSFEYFDKKTFVTDKFSKPNCIFNNKVFFNQTGVSNNIVEFNDILESKENYYKVKYKQVVTWKVTEIGYTYCSTNCLLLKNKKNFSLDDLYKTYWLYFEIFMNNYKEKNKNQFYTTDYTVGFLKNIENITSQALNIQLQQNTTELEIKNENIEYLECIPYISHTQYDFLKGFRDRYQLNSQPEPELITIFDRTGRIDLETLKQRLIQMKKESINGIKLYNRIGNYYRLIGDAPKALECFRKALDLEPLNSDVLINTARLFFKLKLYDDAIFLTQKSLEYVRQDRSPWLQHFTLAEIFKINNYLNEAFYHVQLTIKLKPGYKKATRLFKEITLLLQSKNNNYNITGDKNIFSYYLDSLLNISPSIYLQLSFHMLILFILLLFGVIFSMLNVFFEENNNDINQSQYQNNFHSMDSNNNLKKKNNSIINTDIIYNRFKN